MSFLPTMRYGLTGNKKISFDLLLAVVAKKLPGSAIDGPRLARPHGKC